MYPTITDYNRVLQKNNGSAFTTLHNLVFVPSRTVPAKIFTYGSGSYAVIFKAKEGDNQFAIRCFISANQENYFRYKKLHGYLKNISASWVTQFQFLENEICVNNETYPVVKMDWVDGLLLNDYISQILYNNDAIEKLQKAIIKLSENLEEINVGHGDIQCGNVIITKHSNGKVLIKLIDYDGMFIPAFRNKTNLERGFTQFQHPNRSSVNFDEKIDRFSFWVIIAALEALKHDKTLWLPKMQGGFNSSVNLLFEHLDFVNFNQSNLVGKLRSLNNTALNYYLQQLGSFCNGNPNDVLPPSIFSGQVTSKVSEETWAKAFGSGSTIQIVTNPSGVFVFDRWLKEIGTTPLTLNRADAVGKEFILMSGDNKKTITVEKHHTIIDITLPSTTPVKTVPIPKVVGSGHQKLDDTKENDSQAKKGGFDILAIGIIVLVVLVLIAVIAEVVNKNNSSSNNPIPTQTEVATIPIDTTGASDTTLADTNALFIDSVQLKSCFGKVVMLLDQCHDNVENGTEFNLNGNINYNSSSFASLWSSWKNTVKSLKQIESNIIYQMDGDFGNGSDASIMWRIKFFSKSKVYVTYYFKIDEVHSVYLNVFYDLNNNEFYANYTNSRITRGASDDWKSQISKIVIENDKIVPSNISPLVSNDIFSLVNEIFKHLSFGFCSFTTKFYLPVVENYFGKSNQTSSQVLNACNAYHSNFIQNGFQMDASTFSVTQLSNGDYNVIFNGAYKRTKSFREDWEQFNLGINIILTPELKIKSIYDDKHIIY